MSDTTPAKNLLGRSKELSDMMKCVANRAADEELVKQMERIEEPLKRHVATIVNLHGSLLLMQKAQILQANPVPASKIKPLQERISKLRKRLTENRSQIAYGNVWAECNTQAEARATDLMQQLQQQWKDFITQHTPGIETFRPFAKLPSCKTIFDELLELDLQAKNDQKRLPSTDTEIDAVRARGKRMQKLISELGLEGEPQEMQDFLKQCAQTGVPLDELNNDVLAWLKCKGFAASLRIVTR